MTTSELASQVRSSAGPGIVASVIGDGPGASPAQHAVTAALLMAAGAAPRPRTRACRRGNVAAARAGARGGRRSRWPPARRPMPPPSGSPRCRPAARRAWLMQHLAALRAGRITLAQLP